MNEWYCIKCKRASIVKPAAIDANEYCPRCVPGASAWWITLHLTKEIAATGPRWKNYGHKKLIIDLLTLIDHYIERGGEHPVPLTMFEKAAGAR